ncbi:MAG: carboxypeptidase-like regulatory domain-containing protein [Bacteroidia bacterium]|nr:carboxypeptidase-like regulatory domain-containing protein [Bacteroidia bacterium]
MRTTKRILILVFSIIGFSLNQCKTEEILPGEISGEVDDRENSLPLQEVTVILNPLNDTTTTESDGKFLFENLIPGFYEIQVSKLAYESETKRVEVIPEKTTPLYFFLKGAPIPKISEKNLDFGLDSTIKLFTISNIGKDTLKYSIITNQNWITVFPFSGEIIDETETLTVSINKTGLSNNIQKGEIQISSVIGDEIQKDIVNVFVNGVMDRDLNYYEVVKIGTQTWMAENLNVGIMIPGGVEQTDFQIIKKYCYNNDDRNCKIFGGLYQWSEMMQGAKSDSGNIGTTRGICPVGWHVPTVKEWNTLASYLDETVAGVKLKEAGITHWKAGNVATNESGFTALPGGIWDGSIFDLITSHEYIWTATAGQQLGFNYTAKFEYNSEKVFLPEFRGNQATAVRCIMDPPKK